MNPSDLRQRKPQQANVNIDLSKCEDVTCECGCGWFKELISMKKIPMLISPTGKEEFAFGKQLVCNECGASLTP